MRQINNMKLLIEVQPTSTLRLNENAVVHLLARLMRKRIAQSNFLTRCGIEFGEAPELMVAFDPDDTLRVDERAVGWLLKRILDDEIAKSPFLVSTGVRVDFEKSNQGLRFSANG